MELIIGGEDRKLDNAEQNIRFSRVSSCSGSSDEILISRKEYEQVIEDRDLWYQMWFEEYKKRH